MQLKLPSNISTVTDLGHVYGSSDALVIKQMMQMDNPCIVIAENGQTAQRLQLELNAWLGLEAQILDFPDYEILPYDKISPHPDLISRRINALAKLRNLKSGAVITHVNAIAHKTTTPSELMTRACNVNVGENIDITQFTQDLVAAGYYPVSKVLAHGEFCQRGGILDIFPMASTTPYRIELFDDEVTSIRSFATETQRSDKNLDKIAIQAANEFPYDKAARDRFRLKWRELFASESQSSPIYKAVGKAKAISGLEFFLPLFISRSASFFDHLPSNSQIICIGNISKQSSIIWDEIKHRYEQYSCDKRNPILDPDQLYLSTDQIEQNIQNFANLSLQPNQCQNNIDVADAEHNIAVEIHSRNPAEKLINWLEKTGDRVCFAIDQAGRLERLLELLQDFNLNIKRYENWNQFINSHHKIGIILAPIANGFRINSAAISLISSTNLFGLMSVATGKPKLRDPLGELINNLEDLCPGDPVVHREHGIGRFNGLTVIETRGISAEYIEILYSEDTKVFVPICDINVISRYIGAEPVTLNRLGNKQWAKSTEQARKKIYDVAAELLEIYAKRHIVSAQRISEPSEHYHAFAASFPFTETDDQQTAINAIITDLMSTQKMERLICGDVGFGKTEIAMRAAFLMADNNMQVAVLVPTTLLADQHSASFQNRFASWPIRIATISRFQSAAENKKTKQDLAAGKIDIIVGTHALLGKEIKFKNLGLLILDEEHRFGVRQKEKIKALRTNIDVLSMSATPIPRTLNLALAGITDISIIGTPPAKRLAVKTSLIQPKNSIIRDAILREIMRGGQAYIIHNDVASIASFTEKIQAIVPEAKIRLAHAQMNSRELETIMTDFFHQRFNVLICTTIVESGIDNPTANTIIINRAHRFGLAQLHQLRGRVGRSHHQSYAYLIVPEEEALKADAKKRLEAICQYSDLGAGFSLASADMEIRGAGEMLGEEQSGQIQQIGYGMYLDLLAEAVQNLKSGHTKSTPDGNLSVQQPSVDIDLPASALLPNKFIGDIPTRMQLYQQLNSCSDNNALEDFRQALLDRFGHMPIEAANLLETKKLQLLCQRLGIDSLRASSKHLTIRLSSEHKLDTQKLIALIQRQPNKYKLTDQHTLSCLRPSEQTDAKLFAWINDLMLELSN